MYLCTEALNCHYYRSSRAISLRPERSLSQGFTSLELDTVLEERCSDLTKQQQLEQASPQAEIRDPQAERQEPGLKVPPARSPSQLAPPPQLRKTASVRDDPAGLAKRRSRLQEIRDASSSAGGGGVGEAAAAFTKRESKRDRRRGGGAVAAAAAGRGSSGSGSQSPTMRKSHSLDAAESYSLASIQAPLWVTLTNARTIDELAQQKM
ncbi:GM11419 [Drosophila sechellia]|uniref:GM11419 n=1 Tax=Drosophila sechellia TaxID=7238 RepID=B4IDP7_DROSE|nr:GM11419 [Drosophila sechellia]